MDGVRLGDDLAPVLRSLADRLPGTCAQTVSGIAVDGLTALAGASAAALLRPRRDEETARSLLRLAAGRRPARSRVLRRNLLELTARHRGGRLLTLAATLGSWGVALARIRHEQARAGSPPVDGREAEDDATRVVSIPTAAASGPVVNVALVGVALAESALSSAAASTSVEVLRGRWVFGNGAGGVGCDRHANLWQLFAVDSGPISCPVLIS